MASFLRSALAAVVLSLLVLQNSPADAQVCQDFPSVPGPSPFPVFPDKLQTRVELNIAGKDVGSDIHEFYDYNARKAAIVLRDKSVEYRIIFDYENDEINVYDYYPAAVGGGILPEPAVTFCQTYQLSSSPQYTYLVGLDVKNGQLYPGLANQLFRFYPQLYNGTETVRGIECDVYLSCQYIPEIKTNMTVAFYVSRDKYELPHSSGSYYRLPIRAIHTGVSAFAGDQVEPFVKYYEYYDFRPNQTWQGPFQLPEGVFCENKKNTKPLPGISRRFSYSEEILAEKTVRNLKNVYYDYDAQMVRYEIRSTTPVAQTFYSTDPIVYINVYPLGLEYAINKARGNCTVSTVRSFLDNEFSQTALQSGLGYVVQLEKPESFLGLDANYTYMGQRRVENLLTDVYVSKQTIGDLDIINEYTFTTEGYFVTSTEALQQSVPVTLITEIRRNGVQKVTKSTYYNFDTAEFGYGVFDVSTCSPNSDKFYFRMGFPITGGVAVDELQSVKFIENLVYKALTSATQESPSRFSRPQIDLSEDGKMLLVTSSIVKIADPLKLFIKTPEFYLLVPSLEYVSVNSSEECAEYCLDNSDCLSFDVSEYGSCFLNPSHITSNTSSSTTPSFTHYSRTFLNATRVRPPFKMFEFLKTLVNDGRVSIDLDTVTRDQDGKTVTRSKKLVATLMEQANEPLRVGATSLLSRFNKIKPNAMYNDDLDFTFNGLNIDDCASKCTNDLAIECNSFEYCYLDGRCRLTGKLLSTQANQSDFMPNFYCDIYEKDALSHYIRLPFKVKHNKKGVMFEGKTASECARLCDKETSIECKSFNLCETINKCYLSTKHADEGGVETVEPSLSGPNDKDIFCTHYSRNFIYDFVYTSENELSLTGEVILKDTNLETCSRSCVTADNFLCKSFDYCAATKTCMLNSGLVQTPSQQAQAPASGQVAAQKDICRNYRREYFFLTSVRNNLSSKSDKSETTLIALSVVFTIASVAGGLAVTFWYFKKYKKAAF